MLKKLRSKFILINMVLVTAMLVVIFGMVYRFTANDLEQQSVELVRTLAHDALEPGLPNEKDPDIQLPYFTVKINAWGDIIASGSTYFDLTDTAFLQNILNSVYNTREQTGILQGYSLRFYKHSSMGSSSVAFVDISSQQATLRTLVQTSLIIGALSFGAFLVISFLLARWAVKPVEKAWQQQKQFVSDASHELKTPLTVIMSNAELLQNQSSDEESRQRYAGSILTMSRQMRKLVEGLLELARADNGQVKKAFTLLDFSQLVSDALLPFEAAFYERNMMLDAYIQPGITVNGNAQYLCQVVDILLDNALKYGNAGTVNVYLQRTVRHGCQLRVENPGEPIAEADRQRIFERFYRVDSARSRSGSFGLGLSIAKSVVQEHGGKIWVESSESGNCFCIQLPIQ